MRKHRGAYSWLDRCVRANYLIQHTGNIRVARDQLVERALSACSGTSRSCIVDRKSWIVDRASRDGEIVAGQGDMVRLTVQ